PMEPGVGARSRPDASGWTARIDLFERRKHPRVAKRIRVRWQCVETNGGPAAKVGPVEATPTRDVSEGDLGLSVSHPIGRRPVLARTLGRESGGPPLSALARVARCIREPDGHFVGVEFTWIECALPETALGLSPQNAWTFM